MEFHQSEAAPWVEKNFAILKDARAKEPETVSSLRQRAYERFSVFQIPTTQQEEWRHTNLTPVAKTQFQLSDHKQPELGLVSFLDSRCLATGEVLARVVFVNGRFSNVLSFGSVKELAEGGAQFSLDSANTPELDESDLSNVFISMNTALFQEALTLRVGKNLNVKKPIEVVFLAFGQENPTCYFPRLFLAVEDSSNLSVIERHLSTGTNPKQVNSFGSAVTEFRIGENAELNHLFVQDLGPGAGLVANTAGEIQRSGKYNSHVIQLGGKLIRNEIRPKLMGQGAECLLNGLTVIEASQHVDNFTVIEHAAPNCFSRENYKGVYKDRSSGVFCGTIIVQRDAQKTNAIQSNKSILLSNTASVDTKPQLKIWADDVKCTHGATIGQLDDDALFYLRSRGISKEQAKRILISAFIGEVLEAIPGEPIRAQLTALVKSRLNAAD